MESSKMSQSRGLLMSVQLVTLLGVAGVACQTAAESLNSEHAVTLESTSTQEGLNDLSAALTQVACTKMLACCTSAVVADRAHAAVSDQTGCEAALQPRYTSYVERITNSSMAGRVAYHGDRAKRCLASLQTQSCGDYAAQHFTGPAVGSDCDAWLEPLVNNGGACSDDDECVSGQCAGREVAADGSLQDGKCAALPGLGQACDGSCVAGAFCDTTSEPPRCLPAQGLGAACSDSDQCQSSICDGPVGQTTCQSSAVSCLGN